jgi:hypothetical protein
MANHSTGTGQETTDEDAAVLQFPKGIFIKLLFVVIVVAISTFPVPTNVFRQTAWFRLSCYSVPSVAYLLI